MIATTLLRAPDQGAPGPAADLAAFLEQVAALRQQNAALRAENAAVRAENAALQERVRELEARLGQNSANSSRPPSSDPPQAPARPKAPPSGRERGGQPGHRGACRGLLPVERVDEIVPVVPEHCRIVSSPSLAPKLHAGAGRGGIRWWSYCHSRCGSPSTRWRCAGVRPVGSAPERTCLLACRGDRSGPA
jgi:transposase